MNNSITLKEAIDGVLKCQRENGHPESYLIDPETKYLTDELVTQFRSDNKSSRSGEYRHERFLSHNRCIRFL